MRPRMFLAAGTAALAACVSLVAAPGALAVPAASYTRVVLADASGSQLVFAKQTTGSALTAGGGGRLYAQDRSGDRTRLSSFTASAPVQVNAGTLIQTSATSVHWRDLVSTTEGHAAIASGEQVVTPAPTGWVTKKAAPATETGTSYSLTWVTTTGEATALGSPFTDAIDYTTKDGPTGLLAYANWTTNRQGLSEVAFMPWSKPGHWTSLYAKKDNGDMYCAAPSSTAVACQDRSTEGPKSLRGMGVFALDGSKSTRLAASHPTACQSLNIATIGSALIGVATTNAGSCRLGRLSRFGLDGTLSTSSRTYSTHGLSAGLTGILAGSSSQRSIDSLSSVNKAPKAIVTN